MVAAETREANLTAEASSSCSVKINTDKSIDRHFYIGGRNGYILYRGGIARSRHG